MRRTAAHDAGERSGHKSEVGGVPPFNATGGDLVDQVRDWIERQRERLNGRANGAGQRAPSRRPGRRIHAQPQAVPLGSAGARPASPPRSGGGRIRAPRRGDSAERNTYTLILAAVLLVLVIALIAALNWAFGGSSAPGPTPSPVPTPPPALQAPGQLPPGLSPVPSPSPSPSPDTGPGGIGAPPSGRFHVVEGGDTLNRISQRYSVSVEAIMQANGFTDRARILRIGERLVIPDPGASAIPVGSPIPR